MTDALDAHYAGRKASMLEASPEELREWATTAQDYGRRVEAYAELLRRLDNRVWELETELSAEESGGECCDG